PGRFPVGAGEGGRGGRRLRLPFEQAGLRAGPRTRRAARGTRPHRDPRDLATAQGRTGGGRRTDRCRARGSLSVNPADPGAHAGGDRVTAQPRVLSAAPRDAAGRRAARVISLPFATDTAPAGGRGMPRAVTTTSSSLPS